MKIPHCLVVYLLVFIATLANVSQVLCGEYHHSEYSPRESRRYEHHEHHPPPAKKANVDINIPIDFHTLAKLGIIGLTQLKLLMALGKVAGAGLGVATLGLGTLGRIGLSIGPSHHHRTSHHTIKPGGGIAIDLTPTHQEVKAHGHYEHHVDEY